MERACQLFRCGPKGWSGATWLKPDPPLTAEQQAIVSALTDEQVAEIDRALLANCIERRRKVAAVVGRTMTDQFMDRFEGVPDIYYAARIRALVERGQLESFGDLGYMRYSEVRLPRRTKDADAGQ